MYYLLGIKSRETHNMGLKKSASRSRTVVGTHRIIHYSNLKLRWTRLKIFDHFPLESTSLMLEGRGGSRSLHLLVANWLSGHFWDTCPMACIQWGKVSQALLLQ